VITRNCFVGEHDSSDWKEGIIYLKGVCMLYRLSLNYVSFLRISLYNCMYVLLKWYGLCLVFDCDADDSLFRNKIDYSVLLGVVVAECIHSRQIPVVLEVIHVSVLFV